ncbi:hypothetical protein B0H14DRAFT_3898446 [Mycena olivaceomarginata]|nr:hypothetical protein B0H14DRAFT_3898446 [Mycena olivaceomarginata]
MPRLSRAEGLPSYCACMRRLVGKARRNYALCMGSEWNLRTRPTCSKTCRKARCARFAALTIWSIDLMFRGCKVKTVVLVVGEKKAKAEKQGLLP